MKHQTLTGIVGRDAHVAYFKAALDATVTTFWIETTDARESGHSRKDCTTWHKVAVYGDLQRLATTIQKGDLVSVSGLACAQSHSRRNGLMQSCCLRADSLQVLRPANRRQPRATPNSSEKSPVDLPPLQLHLALTA